MVWGMPLPENFGEFWPSGCFEKDPKTRDDGWYSRLRVYYAEQSHEEQKRLFDYHGDPRLAAHVYGTFPSYKFIKEPGARNNNGLEPPYGSVEPHEIPRSFDTERSHKTLGSLIMMAGGIIAVDERLKGIIEGLEPRLHEFFRFDIRMPKGQVYPGSYYIMRVSQYFDAFSRDGTWAGSVRELPAYQETPSLTRLNVSKKALNGLAVRKVAFRDAHLWRDRTFGEDLTCFSDALMMEIEQAGLRVPKHFKMKEV